MARLSGRNSTMERIELFDLPLHADALEVAHQHLRRQAAVDLELAVPAAPGLGQHLVGEVGRDDAAPSSPGASPSRPARIIAMLYGSWPLEQPADQMVIRRSRARLTSSSGRMCAASASKGSRSRNHEVSFVVIASTTSACSACSGCRLQPGHQVGDRRATLAPGQRDEPRLDEVLLAGLEHDGRATPHQLGDVVEVGGHPRSSGRSRDRSSTAPGTSTARRAGVRSDLGPAAGCGARGRRWRRPRACPRPRRWPRPARRSAHRRRSSARRRGCRPDPCR